MNYSKILEASMHRFCKRLVCVLLVGFLCVGGFALAEQNSTPQQISITAEELRQIKDYSNPIYFEDANEKIQFDYKQGKWSYASPHLQVDIERFEDTKYTLIWYIADVRFDDSLKLEHFFADQENPGKSFKYAENIARDNHCVFAINDDQVGYRLYNHKTVGHVVINGKIFGDKSYKKPVKILPNLDCMAIADDGTMSVYGFNEHTAQEYVDMGFKNVSSFGPYVIRDSQINPYLDNHYTLQEARTVIGMIDKNHYVIFSCEGRRKGKSLGASLKWVGEHLLEKGVTQAFNLDGGGTTSLLFMGMKINYFNPKGEVRKDRSLTGIFGIGKSDLLPAWEGLTKK